MKYVFRGVIIGLLVIVSGVLWSHFFNQPVDTLSYISNAVDIKSDEHTIQDSYAFDTSYIREDSIDTNLVSETSTTVTHLIHQTTMPQVQITTNKGTITVELFEQDAPNTVKNFLKLTNDGFYDGVIFHRVIPGFMIQGGDPTGTGTGGPGYRFNDELNPNTTSYQQGYLRGILAMANAGPNTNGSQFFIMHQDYPLPNAYTIFGRVVDGIEVVDVIAQEQTDGRDRPLEDVVMQSVQVIE